MKEALRTLLLKLLKFGLKMFGAFGGTGGVALTGVTGAGVLLSSF